MGIIQTSIVALLLIAVLYVASFWISTASLSTGGMEKLSAYECGFSQMGTSRMKFEILFYVVGILYLIFDLEIIFLTPLAVIMPSFDSFLIFLIVNLFIVIITIGFLYEYLIGALDLT
ncbi:NADH-ubiquinone/plastoquinone oxidoreductase [Rhizoclosmatium globosum]|uniref:NADH-ubiquinone oxidoreductase chain 3 n=1 Tax=Rhizoclosmatium globosum TaxID=329046 RepID=A0A1Y2AF63_9FUNG|nr:NADH-ubiquinone/plastoquinone oxidoreductase [Rhizoclosmatium globosum]|eukprot:ORY21211.1 NADH-ubiquinone/plastoquinone oxidoreductase [Rhizoclosmatium globosum]